MACRFIQHIPSGCMMTSHLSRDNDILLHMPLLRAHNAYTHIPTGIVDV